MCESLNMADDDYEDDDGDDVMMIENTAHTFQKSLFEALYIYYPI